MTHDYGFDATNRLTQTVVTDGDGVTVGASVGVAVGGAVAVAVGTGWVVTVGLGADAQPATPAASRTSRLTLTMVSRIRIACWSFHAAAFPLPDSPTLRPSGRRVHTGWD